MSLAPFASASDTVVELEFPAEQPFHATGRLVAGGIASRLHLDIDRTDDLRLAVEAILLLEPAERSLTLSLTPSPDALDLEIGPFASVAAKDAGLEQILGALTDDFAIHSSEGGDWIAVRVTRRSGTRGSR